jgi:hypothetical protein
MKKKKIIKGFKKALRKEGLDPDLVLELISRLAPLYNNYKDVPEHVTFEDFMDELAEMYAARTEA